MKKTDKQKSFGTIDVPENGAALLRWAIETAAVASVLIIDLKRYVCETEGKASETCEPKLIKRRSAARRMLRLLSVIDTTSELIYEDEGVINPITAILKEVDRIRKENLKELQAEKEDTQCSPS